MSRSERKTEGDKERAEAVRSPGSEYMISDKRNVMSPGKVNPASSHSYNSRSRKKSLHFVKHRNSDRYVAHLRQLCSNSKFVIFQDRFSKDLKCYNFL